MRTVLVFAVVAAAGQALSPSPQQIAGTTRALQPAEIAVILDGARHAVAEKTIRLSYAPDGPGPDILFGTDGRRRIIRTVGGITGGLVSGDGSRLTFHTTIETIANYTGMPAQGCDGAPRRGELVIEYRNEDNRGWRVAARASTDHEVAAAMLEMLDGQVTVESGAIATMGGRAARAFVAPWNPPASNSIQLDATTGDPVPNIRFDGTPPKPGSRTLWIDFESLRPVRWTVAVPGASPYTMLFTYDVSPEPRAPAGITPSDCVQ
jgi:hypothetical protein